MLEDDVGDLEQVRVPRPRGREQIELVERYEGNGLEQRLLALTVAGLRRRKVVDCVRGFRAGHCGQPASE